MQRAQQSLRPSNPRLHSEMFGTETIPNRPTGKLAASAVGMMVMLLTSDDSSYWQEAGWPLAGRIAAYFPSALFVYITAFHSPGLQMFWGWALIFTGGLSLTLLLTGKSGFSTPIAILHIILQFGVSYLLLLDRSVVGYRSKLRDFYQARRNKAALDQSRLP